MRPTLDVFLHHLPAPFPIFSRNTDVAGKKEAEGLEKDRSRYEATEEVVTKVS